ncbi:MAG: hypothetical protein ACPG6V_08035 [Flavobacteriales bacterium]
MKASQQLRKPENWQDFESLCKKLWSEIWSSPETKKNGRSGQAQQGIDVYGMPTGEKSYYGIQCKGKDDYTNSKLTEKEIDREIKLALEFEPPLKKMYFATTANKDVNIESYIRVKNIEHVENGLFEVHLYSWEDIVDLIDENRSTHDWYLKSQNFKTNQSCQLTFHDNTDEITIKVPFQKNYTEYKQKIIPANSGLNSLILQQQRMSEMFTVKHTSIFDSSINHSWCKFYFRLHNTGNTPIEEYKIFLEFKGDFKSIDTITKGGGLFSPKINYTYDTFIDEKQKTGKIIPASNILVGEDSVGFDDIAIKPIPESKTVNIHWKLVSRDFIEEGDLKLNINIEIKENHKTVLVDDPLKVRMEEGEIEDYITEKE